MEITINNFIESIDWNSPKNLYLGSLCFIPTIVFSSKGEVLGLAYSTKESLRKALETKKGIYYSRGRMELWEKGLNMRNRQVLLQVKKDCDSDSLLFIVEQRGDFCHVPGCHSCFSCDSSSITLTNKRPVRISYATGNCEKISFDFLRKIGISVYKPNDQRSKEFLTKSDYGVDFDLQSWKPKDIEKSLPTSDFILYYKNFMKEETKNIIDDPSGDGYITLNTKTPFKVMRVCLVAKENTILGENSFIANEYPQIRCDYVPGQKTTTFGNSEEYVRKGLFDAAIVIVDTGKTLEATGLKILQVIEESDISLMVSKKFYRENPRLLREIRNVLDETTIYFYSVDGPYGVFSNFYPCSFVDNKGRTWKSSEHYYQAHKFLDVSLFELIKETKTCKECYKVSWNHQKDFRKDWLQVKDQIMYEALYYKYTQNPGLLEVLMKTSQKELVEHSMNDTWYGMGIEGNGKNMLGKLLMKLREYLSQNKILIRSKL